MSGTMKSTSGRETPHPLAIAPRNCSDAGQQPLMIDAMMRPSGFHDGSRAGTTGGLRCVGSQFRFLSLLCWC